ncbi:Toxin-antitoxin system, toxin component, PIN family, partial [Leptospira kirschneri serovar Mozdok]
FRKLPHCGIIRLVNLSSKEQMRVSLYVLKLHEKELLSGAIITASLNKLRLRLPDE